jgi:predicted N-acetyltransferase YhbS
MRRFRLESPDENHPGRHVVSTCFGTGVSAPPGDLVYGVSADGTVVSHLDLYWKTIRVAGRPVDVAAIGQVCTLPEYRNRGLASWLLEAAHEDAQGRVPFAALFGSPAFYGRFGYLETNLTEDLGFLLRPSTDAPTAPISAVELDGQRW